MDNDNAAYIDNRVLNSHKEWNHVVCKKKKDWARNHYITLNKLDPESK